MSPDRRQQAIAILRRIPDADVPTVLADLQRYVGPPAEVAGLARRAADGGMGVPWTSGDLLIAAESLGWPPIMFDGQRIDDESAWREVLADADAADRLAIHAELRATRAASSNVVEPHDIP